MSNKLFYAVIFFSICGLLIIIGTVVTILLFNKDLSIIPGQPTLGKCIIGGCSNQLCLEEGQDTVSTCEWTESYACYQTAKCEKQNTGKCGWTQTDELKSCLNNFK